MWECVSLRVDIAVEVGAAFENLRFRRVQVRI